VHAPTKYRWTGRDIGGQVPATVLAATEHSSDKIKYSESITMAKNGAFYLPVNIQQNTMKALATEKCCHEPFNQQLGDVNKGEKDGISPLFCTPLALPATAIYADAMAV